MTDDGAGPAAPEPIVDVRLRRARRAFFVALALELLLVAYPVQYQVTKVVMVAGALALWVAALLLWWPRRWLRISLFVVLGVCAVLVALPGRSVDRGQLQRDYVRALGAFRAARYWWGGETVVGIDCSGFVREGLVWGQAVNGVRTLNGAPIRDAIGLWWNDASAESLGSGDRTTLVGAYDSINVIPASVLAVGDLAVTADGVHVLVYIGGDTWQEADPTRGRVVTERAPSDNAWFTTPVDLVRWDALSG